MRRRRRRNHWYVATEADIRFARKFSERGPGVPLKRFRLTDAKNIRGQINGPQFMASLAAGATIGLAAMVAHLQSTVPNWAGEWSVLAAAILGTLAAGIAGLTTGDKSEDE